MSQQRIAVVRDNGQSLIVMRVFNDWSVADLYRHHMQARCDDLFLVCDESEARQMGAKQWEESYV